MHKALFFFSLLSFYCIPVSNVNAQERLLLLTDHRPPFQIKTETGQITGSAVNAVRCALEKLRQPYGITFSGWHRAQISVKQGISHGFFSASRNVLRDKYAVLSNTIIEQYWNWYVLNDSSWNPADPSFKKNAIVSSWHGSNSEKWLKEKGYRTSEINVLNTDILVRLLRIGRLNAIFGSNIAIEQSIQKAGLQRRIRMMKGIHKPMGVYFGKQYLEKHPGFLQKFNTAIANCR